MMTVRLYLIGISPPSTDQNHTYRDAKIGGRLHPSVMGPPFFLTLPVQPTHVCFGGSPSFWTLPIQTACSLQSGRSFWHCLFHLYVCLPIPSICMLFQTTSLSDNANSASVYFLDAHPLWHCPSNPRIISMMPIFSDIGNLIQEYFPRCTFFLTLAVYLSYFPGCPSFLTLSI